MSQKLLRQALAILTEERWPMLPACRNGKRPCVKWKQFQNACPTPEELRYWEREFTPTGWAAVTGKFAGIIVVDFDGEAGGKWLAKWQLSPHVRTGSGGLHVYVLHPGWPVPTLNAKVGKNTWAWPGVDVRGDGGYAMLLGRNKDGAYTRLREMEPEPFDALPAELRHRLQNHDSGAAQPKVVSHVPLSRAASRVDAERLVGMGTR